MTYDIGNNVIIKHVVSKPNESDSIPPTNGQTNPDNCTVIPNNPEVRSLNFFLCHPFN